MLQHRLEGSENKKAQKVKLACLRVGDGFYALDIMCIREIVRPLPITPIPKAPPFIDGVVKLRQSVIPVVDLRRRFDLPVGDQDQQQRMIICAVEGRMIGLIVNEVTEVRSYDRDEIHPAPYYLSGKNAKLFPGVCRKGERLYMLLDLKKILESDQPIDGHKMNQQALAAGTEGSEIAYDY
ncbi:MAG TPA: chemotaxis protein CheW [Geopsychrobacteraceae bacterium]|nr:chemotaxis protein CheW [Geopsychrobacteraceae bacterium]